MIIENNITQEKYYLNQAQELGLPLNSQYFNLKTNETMHYLDQGDGFENVIVCVHGNPSWSWYFRHFFKPTLKFRIIAIDHLGMGLSSKVNRLVTIEEHAQNLAKLLQHLNIKSVNLVVHDWGGVIGIKSIMESNVKVNSLIGMNTSFFPRTNLPFRIFATTRKPWLNFFNINLGLFSYAAIYMATHFVLDKNTRSGYLLPYKKKEQRRGIANFLAEIPWFKSSKNFQLLKQCEKKVQELNIPMLALWGMQDFCFDQTYVDYWKKISPQLEVHKFYDAGHWCLEDKTTEICALSEKFWDSL